VGPKHAGAEARDRANHLRASALRIGEVLGATHDSERLRRVLESRDAFFGTLVLVGDAFDDALVVAFATAIQLKLAVSGVGADS
jgi:hypothetical protein